MSNNSSTSYGQIFRSTAFTGGASIVSIISGAIRTKVLAVLIGPSGVGLIGLYSTVTTFALAVASLGIGSSGVRAIAAAAATGDQGLLGRTATTLRRVGIVLGVFGALLLASLSRPVSVLTFGDGSHTLAIMWLSAAVLMGTVAAAESSIIQGFRRISDLARITIAATVVGNALGLPLIWLWRERGIVPMLLLLPCVNVAFIYWFVQRGDIGTERLRWRDMLPEVRSLMGLGVAFALSGIMAGLVGYVIRLMITRQLGLDAAGYYGAAYMLAGIYGGFILQAMGTDFFPRLTAVAGDNTAVNRLVNEQTEIALLLAVPGVLATLACAPWVIHAFYATSFEPAVPVLQWMVVGVLLRVISWPMGFILLAKDRRGLFFGTEALASALHLLLIALGIRDFGVPGTGMAFAVLYVCYAIVMIAVSRRLTGFRWSRVNRHLLNWMVPVVGIVFGTLHLVSEPLIRTAGVAVTVVVGWICAIRVLSRVPAHRLQRFPILARWASQAPQLSHD